MFCLFWDVCCDLGNDFLCHTVVCSMLHNDCTLLCYVDSCTLKLGDLQYKKGQIARRSTCVCTLHTRLRKENEDAMKRSEAQKKRTITGPKDDGYDNC